MISFYIAYFIFSLLIASSILYTWFNSHLPQLCCSIFYTLGFKRKQPKFWMIPEDRELGIINVRNPLSWTEDDWQSFANNSLPLFFSTLLTCRYCLCYHATFWSNLFLAIPAFILFDISILQLLFIVLIYSISQPILVHILFKYLDRE